MDELTVAADILCDLIIRTRNYMAREEVQAFTGISDEDGRAAVLETRQGDPEFRELADEIDGLDDEQKVELVALMWVGRGDFDADEWDDALALAVERHKGPTAFYLLSHPMVADYWSEGVDKLFDGSDLLSTGKY